MSGSANLYHSFFTDNLLVNPPDELSRIEPAAYSLPIMPPNTGEREAKIWALLATVPDPEVPVLSVVDLGIIRNVIIEEDTLQCNADTNQQIVDFPIVITITPTYSGCPAMDTIALNIRIVLVQEGFKNIILKTVLSPAWTTEWMSEAGKEKLKNYGIAPPNPMQQVCQHSPFQQQEAVQCPRCNAYTTQLVSQFGSTACKALYQCQECKEPFDYFKCH